MRTINSVLRIRRQCENDSWYSIYIQVEQRLETTSRVARAVCTFATSLHRSGLHRSHASAMSIQVSTSEEAPTSSITLSLISWNSARATRSSGSPPCKSAITRIPSSSLSLSISHLKFHERLTTKTDARCPTVGFLASLASLQQGAPQ